ncbi:MAG: ribonuclease J [Spirochaetes bacterium]|nr:ribonuclease J [Spirochaetota bacterium]
MKDEKVKIIPIGGLNAIGKNMMVLEYENDIIIVDCGMMFPTEEMHGVDLIIPDFSYVEKHTNKVRGIIITHGHEDHIGGVPYLLQKINAPIYASRLTIGLIRSRLEEKLPLEKKTFIEVAPKDVVHIGEFIVEFIRVNHSIIDGVGLAITTPIGTILHTGDFKIDLSPVDREITDLARIAELGERGILLLLSDSTNAEQKGFTKSESVLIPKLSEIFSSSKGRIFVATFASNISRIQQVFDIAQRYNRHVVISGNAMHNNIEIARDLGYLKYKDGIILDIKEAERVKGKKLVVLCTGTQGEPMSALTRLAEGTHKNFAIDKGDTVIITASVIPGNDRLVNNVVNSLLRMGAEVYWERDEDIHVSGHASQEELKLILSLTKPKFFIPIHGEYRHLKAHAMLARSLGMKESNVLIAQNGDIISITKKAIGIEGKIPVRDIFVDGDFTFDIESGVIKERAILSKEGMIIITCAISRNHIISGPHIFMRGVAFQKDNKFRDSILAFVEDHIEKMLSDEARVKEIQDFLKKSVPHTVHRITKTNPLVEIHIIEV